MNIHRFENPLVVFASLSHRVEYLLDALIGIHFFALLLLQVNCSRQLENVFNNVTLSEHAHHRRMILHILSGFALR